MQPDLIAHFLEPWKSRPPVELTSRLNFRCLRCGSDPWVAQRAVVGTTFHSAGPPGIERTSAGCLLGSSDNATQPASHLSQVSPRLPARRSTGWIVSPARSAPM